MKNYLYLASDEPFYYTLIRMNKFAGIPIFILCVLAWFYGCATPRAPSGGEPDRTGPNVISTYPESGTVNFEGNEVEFTFDQFVDRNSFRQNVSIEPDLGIEFEIDFSRKSATVSFNSPLPDNTTIAVRVGSDVTDTNRNKMGVPVDLALSTGPVLDNGKVVAKVVDAETGETDSGSRVLLYREDADISERAIYMAESDTSGTIEFSYISEGTYRAFWLRDQNRNRIWEREREQAQPFYVNTFDIAQDDSLFIGELYVFSPDTTSPKIEGVGLFSERRLRLRASEPLMWEENAEIAVFDTLGNRVTTGFPLYELEDDPNVIFAQTENALNENSSYTLSFENIFDDAGNAAEVRFDPFAGSAQEDTTRLKTVSHNTGSGIFPNEAVEITYTKFIDDESVLDSLRIIEGDRVIDTWPRAEIDRNILRIKPDTLWQSGLQYQFRVWNPWEQEREQIEPDIWQRNELGGIEIITENADSSFTTHVKLQSEDLSIEIDTTFTGSIEIDNLPPLSYNASLFVDENGDGKWGTGSVDPYIKPEPYFIRRNIPVREGFTSELGVEFTVGEILRGKVNSAGTNNFSEEIESR
jgi:hypothetical protein